MASDDRQDDLRGASDRLSTIKHQHLKEMAELRSAHSRELNEAETKRIDAIRSVDVGAVAIATERATAAATVLANQVTQSAETLRALVATTATASQQQSSASFTQLSDRITLLERGSYEGVGKSAVADPAMARMVAALEKLQLGDAKGQGREGLSTPLLMAITGTIMGLIGFIIQAMLK